MCKSLALYEPNYNTIPGTDEFWLNQQKYVRICCYVSSGYNLEILCSDWRYLTDIYLTDFGYKNFARQYYYKVLFKVPRVTPK